MYTMQRAISELPVGHQRLRTIYRDVTRKPFRLHPSAFPPENFFNSCRFYLLSSREFAWLLILLQTFRSRAYPPERPWMCAIFVTSQQVVCPSRGSPLRSSSVRGSITLDHLSGMSNVRARRMSRPCKRKLSQAFNYI